MSKGVKVSHRHPQKRSTSKAKAVFSVALGRVGRASFRRAGARRGPGGLGACGACRACGGRGRTYELWFRSVGLRVQIQVHSESLWIQLSFAFAVSLLLNPSWLSAKALWGMQFWGFGGEGVRGGGGVGPFFVLQGQESPFAFAVAQGCKLTHRISRHLSDKPYRLQAR